MSAVLPLSDRIRGEGAVQAGGRTERNADIQTVSLFIVDCGKQLALSLGNLNA